MKTYWSKNPLHFRFSPDNLQEAKQQIANLPESVEGLKWIHRTFEGTNEHQLTTWRDFELVTIAISSPIQLEYQFLTEKKKPESYLMEPCPSGILKLTNNMALKKSWNFQRNSTKKRSNFGVIYLIHSKIKIHQKKRSKTILMSYGKDLLRIGN